MIIYKQAQALSDHVLHLKSLGKTISFVPTMGALHSGHMSLIHASRGVTVCSVFVNPTQFNDPQDYAKYPITLESDIQMLKDRGTDILFLPSVEEIYPHGISMEKRYPIGGHLELVLEGAHRPNHFQGVCQVVDRLIEIVMPDELYLGQKDFQQCLVLQEMVKCKGASVRIEVCPTLREEDGLAMSSRNTLLDKDARAKASSIYQSLCLLRQFIKDGCALENAKSAAEEKLAVLDSVDYVAICDMSLRELSKPISEPMIALIAASVGGVRLIDNMIFEISRAQII